MMRSRPIVRSVLCCLLCLTVCAVPALAGNEQYPDGFFYWGPGAYVNVTANGQTVDMLSGHFPASISEEDISTVDSNFRSYNVKGTWVDFGSQSGPRITYPEMYVEVLFPVPAPLTVTISGVSSSHIPTMYAYLEMNGSSSSDGSGGSVFMSKPATSMDCVYDSQYVSANKVSSTQFQLTTGDYDIKRYFGYRFYFGPYDVSWANSNRSFCLGVRWDFNGTYSFTEPNFLQSINDNVIVNTGILQEINGTLTDIKTSTVQIQNDVSEIKGGLQDSNSSIWGAFKESVSGLFVPSSSDLEGVKNGFDQLAQEKLGGAYQTIDLVDNGVQSVVDKFKNPGSSPGVEFPGISVPLGGDVGTVTLAASQTVTIPEQITNVLYPVAGVIIPIVCVIWTIRQCTDMVECFMSGMSYAEFLHRNSDEEDEEV